jgi:hypothetical protein
MLLHLGADVSVFAKDVVMIMDAQRAAQSPALLGYLNKTRQSGHYFHLCQGEPRSYVLIKRGEWAPVLYTSGITAATLYRRCIHTAMEF